MIRKKSAVLKVTTVTVYKLFTSYYFSSFLWLHIMNCTRVKQTQYVNTDIHKWDVMANIFNISKQMPAKALSHLEASCY